jgi:capsular polysaccharide biosynthesis protein
LLNAIPSGNELPIIVPSRLHRYHEETLAAAGVTAARRASFDDAVVEVERLFYPEMLSPTGHTSPHAIAWLRDVFAGHLSLALPHRRLYVTRRDARRRILNEDAVITLVGQYGFEVVCPGDLSVVEQVTHFSEASVIVGPHGAGFTNMIFAPEGATLVELFGSNYVNGCFWAITNLRRQRHAFVTFDTETLDYSVDLDRVRAILEKLAVL